MKKSLRPPENWQDFESLCKKLFGEMLLCENTIKKNGRLGQSQNGVDIYGIDTENKGWGIQCKGIDNYSNKKLTEDEVVAEIEKAKNFKPELDFFVITTTAQKDVKIEEFVRLKDFENRRFNSFRILLYSWEDLVDLIDEYINTYNWYVNSISFKTLFDVEVSTHTSDSHDNNTIKPTFNKIVAQNIFDVKNFTAQESLRSKFKVFNGFVTSNYTTFSNNLSWCKLGINIYNSGNKVIEDWKIFLTFDNNIKRISDGKSGIEKLISNSNTTTIYEEDKELVYKPYNNQALIQKDSKYFEFFILPFHYCRETYIEWELLARDFNRSGRINLIVEPQFIINEVKNFVKTSEEAGEVITFSEFIEETNQDN